MSDISQLKDSVLKQAHDKGHLLLAEAKKKIEQERQAQEAKLLQEKLQQRSARLSAVQRSSQRELQQLENQRRQSSLTIKQRVLGELFEEAYASMLAWSAEQELAFIESILEKYPQEELSLTFGALSRDKLSPAQEESLKQTYPQLTFLEETLPNQAGFVLSKDRVDDSYLYRDLIAAVRQEESYRLAQAIFRDSAE